jgi:hypothetical protein
VLGPVLNFVPHRGMRIAVSFDDQPPQVLDLFAEQGGAPFGFRFPGPDAARDNARFLRSTHQLAAAGPHVLKLAMVDPAMVVQKIIVEPVRRGPGFRGLRPAESYFGPPESLTVK